MSYSSDTKQATIRFIKSDPRYAELPSGKRPRLDPSLLSQARAVAGGASDDSIRRWLDEDISPEAETERLSKRGRKQKYSDDFQSLLLGYAATERKAKRVVSGKSLQDFARQYFGYELRLSWISELLAAHRLSSQQTLPRNSRMVSPEVAEECVDFILETREEAKEFPGLVVMDETGLWSNVVQPRTYHFTNLCVSP